ncbi:uncharacterized protein HaLaN_13139 [Haematococcus lacustris]|uniref:UDP-3-O-acyl-N-acetylglucosamine deacetylase n=1 Tax=Haematococcus lacustris TaxID=44745 RepID=A0A699Z295_HAELA|nr:uncharacterized protein HaLaN_13139 [Haematococcus lacustris]
MGSNCIHTRAHTRCTRIVVTAAGTKSAAVLEEPDVEDDRDVGTQSWLKKDPKDNSPYVLEKGAPPPPIPGEYQQTLMKSFTIGGIGLHTGEYTTVRVRPAFANEGRYFVRVPEGELSA